VATSEPTRSRHGIGYRHALWGLCVITDPALIPAHELAARVERAIRGGARLVQYRNKEGTREQRRREANSLRRVCGEHGIPLIINDDVALARGLGADGVHLGAADTDAGEARGALGPEIIIGVSCYNELERALAAQADGADYVAFGSFYASPTKPHAVKADIALLREAKRKLSIPICAIGGVTAANAGTLVAAGADLIASIGGVFAEPDPEAAARRLARLFI
jgi:thiamine-phosphate pyrophosphorylase